MKSNHEVCKLFMQGKKGRSKHVYSEGDVIYSYGEHFPMGYRLKDGKYLLNGDRYSVTTGCHMSALAGVLGHDRHPRISMSAVNAALRVNAKDAEAGIRGLRVVEFVPDRFMSVSRSEEGFEDWTVPAWATTSGVRKHKDGTVWKKWAHRIGTVLLRTPSGRFLLCGMDGRDSYFVAHVPGRPASVVEATEALRPQAVREADAAKRPVLRQGDWFFVALGAANYRLPRGTTVKDADLSEIVPKARATENKHVVTEARIIGRTVFGRGCVRHVGPHGERGDHPRLTLKTADGQRGWWVPVQNTARGSWSANGRVD